MTGECRGSCYPDLACPRTVARGKSQPTVAWNVDQVARGSVVWIQVLGLCYMISVLTNKIQFQVVSYNVPVCLLGTCFHFVLNYMVRVFRHITLNLQTFLNQPKQ